MANSSMKSAAKANLLGKREPEDDLETNPILKRYKENSEEKETTKGLADILQQIKGRVELLEAKSDQANLISVKEPLEGLDEPVLIEEVSVRKKTLFVGHISFQTQISDIYKFFKNVGEVVRVQLIVNRKGKHVCIGYVEFASANEAKKALQKKNGEYLHDRKIVLQMAKKAPRHKYCIDHKVWHKDYLQRESLPIEEDETPTDFVEEVLFVANLSPQTKISHIIDFFKDVGAVVSFRLIVNREGKPVGYGFVEFASANEAKEALEKMNGKYLLDHKIFLDVAKTAPYPPRPKYNLAEKLCYDDYLRRESLVIEEDETETVEGLDEDPEAVAVRKKTLFASHLSRQTEISHLINFFKDVGEVVHVRLIVDHRGKHVGFGLVEFASANEAKNALEKKNGEIFIDRKIFLKVAKPVPYTRPMYYIDHNVWYEDYLRRESLLIEEEDETETVEGLVEEVAVRKRTLFVDNIAPKTGLSFITNYFKDVGEVVGVRLIVDRKGNHVGCGYLEFASANEAKKALQEKNGENFRNLRIFLDVAEIAPYPLRPKYNLAEKLWYERESLLIEEDDLETKQNLKKQKVPGFCGKKITFSDDD